MQIKSWENTCQSVSECFKPTQQEFLEKCFLKLYIWDYNVLYSVLSAMQINLGVCELF